jgi:hypothetical protein
VLSSYAQQNIFFYEAQWIGSYRSENEEFVYYSHHQHDAMQKPSLGFDFLSRFRRNQRDFAYVSVQGRLAYEESAKSNLSWQLYNAFINFKIVHSDIWIGHNKTALGLSSFLDNHALLMKDNTMTGLNFDRDWGIGFYRDSEWGNISLSTTTGSGMPFYFKHNYFLVGRFAKGNFLKENYSIGFSVAYGEILKTMGYTFMHDKVTHETKVIGADMILRILNFEIKSDNLYGYYGNKPAYSSLLRIGYSLMSEDQMLVELQSILSDMNGSKEQNYSIGFAYRIHPDFTIRTLVENQYPDNHLSLVLQIYFYKGFIF